MNVSDKMYGVIVIGGHVQGLGITRIFGKNNIPVWLLDDQYINLTKHSKFCKKFIKYTSGTLLETLLQMGRSGQAKNWLLMPTNDAHVEVLSKNYTTLSEYFKVSSPEFDVLNYFFNKRETYKLAAELEIPIPETHMPDSLEALSASEVKYPCIIKPAVMHTFYSKTKKKVFVCNDFEELKSNYAKALELIPKDEVIVQDIIPGGSEHQYSACFMFDGSKSLVRLCARRARQHPPDFGNATTYAETVSIDEINQYAIRILEATKYRGVCEVEFKYDQRDGRYKFLEVNPRTWKWHSIAEKANAPILMSLYAHSYGLEEIVKNEYDEATFMHILTDVPTRLKMRRLKMPYHTRKENTKYAVRDASDWWPSFFELLYLPYFILKR